jgi:CHAD domain-containing protein
MSTHIDVAATNPKVKDAIHDLRMQERRLRDVWFRLGPHKLSLEEANDAIGELRNLRDLILEIQDDLLNRQMYAIARSLS